MVAIRFPTQDPVLVLPFTRLGGTGTVSVYAGTTADPAAVGFDLVAARYDGPRFSGFPVVRAEPAFDQEGYRACFGWLQVLSRTTATTGTVDVDIDMPPFQAGLGTPLYCFGYLPVLFDAPANSDHPDGDWLAETFLVAIPDLGRSRALAALTAFDWGYRLTAGRPEPLPVRPVGADRWRAHLPVLAAAFPAWDFLDSSW